MTGEPFHRLKGLDALRGIAALVVLSYHVAAIFAISGQPNGYLAVDFFFMLSGFVIAGVLERTPEAGVEFVCSRYKRFWPTMAAGTAIGLFVTPYSQWWEALPGFMLLPIFSSAWVFPLNSPTWSIFFELYANAVHSVMRRLWPAVFFASLALLIVTGGFGGGPTPGNFFQGFPRVLLSYSLGVMMFQRWTVGGLPLKIPACFGLLLLTLLVPWQSPWLDYSFVLLICPLLIMSGVKESLPFAEKLGALSFPLYAIHYPLLLAGKSLGAGPVASAALAIAVAGTIAWLLPKRYLVADATRGGTRVGARARKGQISKQLLS